MDIGAYNLTLPPPSSIAMDGGTNDTNEYFQITLAIFRDNFRVKIILRVWRTFFDCDYWLRTGQLIVNSKSGYTAVQIYAHAFNFLSRVINEQSRSQSPRAFWSAPRHGDEIDK